MNCFVCNKHFSFKQLSHYNCCGLHYNMLMVAMLISKSFDNDVVVGWAVNKNKEVKDCWIYTEETGENHLQTMLPFDITQERLDKLLITAF